MSYIAKQEGTIISVKRKGQILSVEAELCRIDKDKRTLSIIGYNFFEIIVVATIEFSEIKKIIGRCVSNTLDHGSYIAYGVALITEDFEYLIDIHGKNPAEARELIAILKENIA